MYEVVIDFHITWNLRRKEKGTRGAQFKKGSKHFT